MIPLCSRYRHEAGFTNWTGWDQYILGLALNGIGMRTDFPVFQTDIVLSFNSSDLLNLLTLSLERRAKKWDIYCHAIKIIERFSLGLGQHTQTSLQYCISTTCNFTPTGAFHFCQFIYWRNLRLEVEHS